MNRRKKVHEQADKKAAGDINNKRAERKATAQRPPI